MPDFEVMKKFMEDDGRRQLLDREIANTREILRENKRDAELRRRILRGHFGSRWLRHTNLDETLRMPSLFTWHY
jgi:hypothetical protein